MTVVEIRKEAALCNVLRVITSGPNWVAPE